LERIDSGIGTTPERSAAAPASPLPLVVAVMGLPGAGKTTVARAIERQLGLRRVCRDAIRRAMFPRCDFSFVETRATFRSVMLAVEINCLLGESTVIDGMSFARRHDFEQIATLAAAHGFDALPLLIDCPAPLARDRIARASAAARLGGEAREAAVVDAVLATFETPPLAAVRIDGARPLAQMCALALSEVAARIGRSDLRA
jgi:predicted kinase